MQCEIRLPRELSGAGPDLQGLSTLHARPRARRERAAEWSRRERTQPHDAVCACHCAACRAAGHGNKCVVLRMGLLRLFHGEADPVDLVLQHYYHGASGWDTARFDAAILSVQYGPAGDVIAAGADDGGIHLVCAQTGAKTLCLKGHR